MDLEKLLIQACQQGIVEGLKTRLTGYNGPLDRLVEGVLKDHDSALRKVLSDSLVSAVTDPGFHNEIRTAVRHKLASTLVNRFGGELEKQVNALKSDPTTRARITLAIDEIVKEKSQPV